MYFIGVSQLGWKHELSKRDAYIPHPQALFRALIFDALLIFSWRLFPPDIIESVRQLNKYILDKLYSIKPSRIDGYGELK